MSELSFLGVELIEQEVLQSEDSYHSTSHGSLFRKLQWKKRVKDSLSSKRKSIIVRDHENYRTPEIFGIKNVIEKEPTKPKRDLLMEDFTMIDESHFNVYEAGFSALSKPKFNFFFKAYAPMAFCCFRHLYGIKPDILQDSVCENPLRKLSSTGKSGSVFYVSYDGRFILKTLQFREAKFLIRLLPKYYLNLSKTPITLLPKFFGLFCYKSNGKRIMTVIMNNLLPTNSDLHHIYDLKGSTLKRTVKECEQFSENITHKDLDFLASQSSGLYIEEDIYRLIMEIVKKDCTVLESFDIIDYSLLLGIHNLDQSRRERKYGGLPLCECKVGTESIASEPIRREDLRNIQELMIIRKEIVDNVFHKFKPPRNEFFGVNARNLKGERLMLYFGIIDILESFWLKKKLELCWKSLIYDVKTISVQRPKNYSGRFQDFLGKSVFKIIPGYCFASQHKAKCRKSLIPQFKKFNRIPMGKL